MITTKIKQLPLENLKKFIGHEDFFLREAANRTFHQIFSRDSDVVHQTLESVERYGWEKNAIQLLNCREMFLDSEAVQFLCKKFGKVKSNETRKHICRVIEGTSPNILQENIETIESTKILAKSLAVIRQKVDFLNRDPDMVWQQLWNHSNKNRNSGAESKVLDAAEAMVLALAQTKYPDEKVLLTAFCSEEVVGEWIEVWLADLIGERRIKAGIPHIIELFEHDGDYHLERAMWALGKIGDLSACELIRKRFHNEEEYFRIYASTVFEMIYFPESVEGLVNITRNEREDWINVGMMRSILDLNSEYGFQVVLEMIRDYEHDPEVADVQHRLVTQSDLLDLDFSERDRWRVDRDRIQAQFEEEMKKPSRF